MSTSNDVEKVIVAVHGIGDQTQFATLQQVVSQFCQYHGKVAGVPLGNFHVLSQPSPTTDPKAPEVITPLVLSSVGYSEPLRKFAFAEVYWADIARKLAEEKYSLEDVQPWVRTVISRVRMHKLSKPEITEEDQIRIEQVLGEMLQTVTVLERLCLLADKLGVFSFDLKKILVDYVDDVQVVAEFKAEGQKIGNVFASRMNTIYQNYPNAEIHLVAHSEGTVVALLGLLSAICNPQPPAWIKNVRGFMTFGSPINKHLILWPELFEVMANRPCKLSPPIEWHNYYDFGDPVGFDLYAARETFSSPDWKEVFRFPEDHDHGFARYPFPGKAHVDYWNDPDVFGHFIQNVVYKDQKVLIDPPPKVYKAPASKLVSQALSRVVPYLSGFLLLYLAVLTLYNAAYGAFRLPSSDAEKILIGNLSLDREALATGLSVLAITCLLAGLTVAVRIPRLTKLKRWHLIGLGVFLLSILANRSISCGFDLKKSGHSFGTCMIDETIQGARGFSMAGLAFLVLVAAYLLSRYKPAWGTQALLIPGGIGTIYALFHYIREQISSSPTVHQFWPMLLATALFLYVWWLVALLFDLVFVWHRYIRNEQKLRYLRLPEDVTISEQAGKKRGSAVGGLLPKAG